MDSTQLPLTCGRGKGRVSQGHSSAITGASGQDQTRLPKSTVQWQADSRCSEKVMEYLCSHPANCRVLFYSDTKSHADGNRPSANSKASICQIIAKHVFEHDSEYADHYLRDPEKSSRSTNSQISGLKKRYREYHNKLHSTGSGITPLDETTAMNLHTQILEEFPWYDDLAAILGGNPAVSLKTVSSFPGADHAGNYLSLVQRSTAKNPQPSSGGYAPSAQPSPSAQPPSPSAQLPSDVNFSDPSTQYGGYVPSPPSSRLPPSTNYSGSQYGGYVPPPSNSHPPSNTNYSGTQYGAFEPSSHPPPPNSHLPSGINYSGTHTHPTPPVATYGKQFIPYDGYDQPFSHPGQQQSHTPLNHEDGGMDYGGNDYGADNGGDDLNMSGSIMDLNSPRSAHKRQLPPSSPSPPITPPPSHSEFSLPKKQEKMLCNSRAAFGAPVPTRRPSRGSLKPLSALRSSHSRSSSTSTPSIRMSTTPTLQSAASEGKGRKSKKARSGVLSQVDLINNEISSLQSDQSDKVSRAELKNDHYMAKLNLA